MRRNMATPVFCGRAKFNQWGNIQITFFPEDLKILNIWASFNNNNMALEIKKSQKTGAPYVTINTYKLIAPSADMLPQKDNQPPQQQSYQESYQQPQPAQEQNAPPVQQAPQPEYNADNTVDTEDNIPF